MTETIKVKNLSVSYSDEGAGDSILILHGWGSSLNSWKKVQSELVQKGYRVIVPDLPGFGKTMEPDTAWSLKDYSEFIHELAQALGINYFTLGGHSFGGRITMDYALRYPRQLHTIILMDAAGITRAKGLKIKIFFILTRVGDLIFSLPILSFARSLTKKIWYQIAGEKDYYRASPRMKETMKRIMEENIRIHLPKITRPTLILWGRKRHGNTCLRRNNNTQNNTPHTFTHIPQYPPRHKY